MRLQLSITANYKAVTSTLNVDVNGSHVPAGLMRRSSYASVKITLIRGIVRPGSPAKVYITTVVVKNIPIGIEKNGSFFQDGSTSTGTGGVTISKRISNEKFHYAEVIVEVYNSIKTLATGRYIIRQNSR